MICPKCRDTEMLHYDGALGYESLKCPKCNLDAKDATHYHNQYESEMRANIAELQEKLSITESNAKITRDAYTKALDKLHRRNLQISDLKKNQCPWNIVKDCKKSAVN